MKMCRFGIIVIAAYSSATLFANAARPRDVESDRFLSPRAKKRARTSSASAVAEAGIGAGDEQHDGHEQEEDHEEAEERVRHSTLSPSISDLQEEIEVLKSLPIVLDATPDENGNRLMRPLTQHPKSARPDIVRDKWGAYQTWNLRDDQFEIFLPPGASSQRQLGSRSDEDSDLDSTGGQKFVDIPEAEVEEDKEGLTLLRDNLLENLKKWDVGVLVAAFRTRYWALAGKRRNPRFTPGLGFGTTGAEGKFPRLFREIENMVAKQKEMDVDHLDVPRARELRRLGEKLAALGSLIRRVVALREGCERLQHRIISAGTVFDSLEEHHQNEIRNSLIQVRYVRDILRNAFAGAGRADDKVEEHEKALVFARSFFEEWEKGRLDPVKEQVLRDTVAALRATAPGEDMMDEGTARALATEWHGWNVRQAVEGAPLPQV